MEPTDIELRDGWWWPKRDKEGWEWIPYESQAIPALVRWCKQKRVLVQAGANCGYWIKKYAELFETIYTVEPDPINWECLTRNVKEPNVNMMMAAFGAERGYCKTVENIKDNNGANRVEIVEAGTPVITIDGLALPVVDLIQLDVEGFEQNAIAGAVETIERCRPVIVVELNGNGDKYGFSDYETRIVIQSMGYLYVETVIADNVFVPQEWFIK